MQRLGLVLLVATALGLGACRSAYYSTLETFGVHKREILVDRVEEGREEQAEAQQQFVATFQTFQQLTGASGGELEEVYERLKDELERCEAQAGDVNERIDSIETVAGDLFAEWSDELNEISSVELRGKSRATLLETQERYEQLIGAMRAAEAKMEPVLVAFRDHVLFLKHNLNARAVASLQDTVIAIEDEVADLVEDMQRSIQEADDFLASMGA
jgi:hypothetical protein